MAYLGTTFLLLVGVIYIEATTTPMMPSTTHPEHSEFESFQFQFDGATGMMVVRQKDTCYIWQLTDQEHQQIHTDDGLRNVELRLMKQIEQAYFTVVPKAILNPSLTYSCSRMATHFYLVH